MPIIKDRVVINFEEGDSCVVSQASWEALKPYLEQAFHLGSNELLVSVEIGDSGVIGRFRSISTTTPRESGYVGTR